MNTYTIHLKNHHLENFINSSTYDTDYGKDLLIQAINRKDLQAITTLLTKVDPNCKNIHCNPVIHVAFPNIEIIRLLLDHGSNVNSYDSFGESLLSRICHGIFYHIISLEDKVSLAKLLLERGEDVNFKDKKGNSLLHVVQSNDIELVKLLLEYHIEPGVLNNDGISPKLELQKKGNSVEFACESCPYAPHTYGWCSSDPYCYEKVNYDCCLENSHYETVNYDCVSGYSVDPHYEPLNNGIYNCLALSNTVCHPCSPLISKSNDIEHDQKGKSKNPYQEIIDLIESYENLSPVK